MNFHALAMILAASSMAAMDGRSDRFVRDLQEAGRTKREPVRTDEDRRRIAAAQAKRERRARKRAVGIMTASATADVIIIDDMESTP